jgi:hypothetical protein
MQNEGKDRIKGGIPRWEKRQPASRGLPALEFFFSRTRSAVFAEAVTLTGVRIEHRGRVGAAIYICRWYRLSTNPTGNGKPNWGYPCPRRRVDRVAKLGDTEARVDEASICHGESSHSSKKSPILRYIRWCRRLAAALNLARDEAGPPPWFDAVDVRRTKLTEEVVSGKMRDSPTK